MSYFSLSSIRRNSINIKTASGSRWNSEKFENLLIVLRNTLVFEFLIEILLFQSRILIGNILIVVIILRNILLDWYYRLLLGILYVLWIIGHFWSHLYLLRSWWHLLILSILVIRELDLLLSLLHILSIIYKVKLNTFLGQRRSGFINTFSCGCIFDILEF